MIKTRNFIAAVLLTVAPVSAFAAGAYTIPSVPLVGGNAGPMLDGMGPFDSSGGGIYGSPGLGVRALTIGGLSSTFGATGAATGGLGGTSGGFTGTTGGFAGASGGLAGGSGR